MLILLGVGIVALGVMVTRVDRELADLSHTLLKIADDVRMPKSPATARAGDQEAGLLKGESSKLVSQKALRVGDKVFVFAQRCDGGLDVAAGQTEPFCVGQNQLTLASGNDKPEALDTRQAMSAQAAPVLRSAIFVSSSSGPGTVLLAYGPDTCVTTNHCGMGRDPLVVTYAYNLAGGAGALRPLNHYPATGMSTWNPSGTRAIIVQDTCMEGGCSEAALAGYDLVSDVVQPASTEKAAGSFGGLKTDANGRRVAVWGNVTWKSDTEYSVTMTDAKGKTKAIEGKF